MSPLTKRTFLHAARGETLIVTHLRHVRTKGDREKDARSGCLQAAGAGAPGGLDMARMSWGLLDIRAFPQWRVYGSPESKRRSPQANSRRQPVAPCVSPRIQSRSQRAGWNRPNLRGTGPRARGVQRQARALYFEDGNTAASFSLNSRTRLSRAGSLARFFNSFGSVS